MTHRKSTGAREKRPRSRGRGGRAGSSEEIERNTGGVRVRSYKKECGTSMYAKNGLGTVLKFRRAADGGEAGVLDKNI